MGKYNYSLLEFAKRKNKIIKDLVGCDIFWKEDYKELSKWGESKSKFVLKHLNTDSDPDLCPWCIIHSDCQTCGYGKRHKKCTERAIIFEKDSTYRAIMNKLHYLEIESISSIQELINLV